uniref:Uncharacterized protein n=1 Tax=Arundo donax TaxID=35708 RepID=A0A0A9BM62_ARUDO
MSSFVSLSKCSGTPRYLMGNLPIGQLKMCAT